MARKYLTLGLYVTALMSLGDRGSIKPKKITSLVAALMSFRARGLTKLLAPNEGGAPLPVTTDNHRYDSPEIGVSKFVTDTTADVTSIKGV